jgi:hypothetical protein
MKNQSIVDELRSQLASLEGRQVELIAEREEISYLALVDRDKKAIERLAEINTELANTTSHASSLTAALREASSRETKAHEQEMAQKRRDDARRADVVLAEAEKLALKLDHAMAALKRDAIAFEQAMAEVRRLSGAGPQHTAMRSHLARAISSGLIGLPQHPDVLAPGERHSVTSLTTSWANQVRHRISTIIETAKTA